MEPETKRYRLDRAKQVLRDIHHIPVATVNVDGSPHSSPVFMAFDDSLCGYWASNSDSLHSQNIARDPRVFLAIFDSRQGHSGLFLGGAAKELTNTADLRHGFDMLQQLKQQVYGTLAARSAYAEKGQQRIYQFTPEHAWVNHSDKDTRGVIIRDRRYEVPISELLR